MTYLSKSTSVATEEKSRFLSREVAKMPEAGEDKAEDYVIGIKQKHADDIEHVHILGIAFHAKIRSPEASVIANSEKSFPYGYLVLSLTQKQVDALWDRAKKTSVHIPHRYRWDSENRDALSPRDFVASDIIFIIKKSEFNPVTMAEEFYQDDSESVDEIGEQAKSEVYKLQKRKVKI